MFSNLALVSLAASVLAANTTAGACTSPVKNKELRELTATEQANYFAAIKCLRAKNSKLNLDGAKTLWEDMVVVHSRAASQIHNTAQFLPWHRSFLAIFDNFMKTECGYTGPGVYWDWTVDSQAPDQSPIWQTMGNNAHGCVSIPAVGALNSNVPTQLHPANDRCVKRDFVAADGSSPAMLGSAYSPQAITYLSTLTTYDSFRRALESGPHNNVHGGVGGDMGYTTSSPNDPIFFMHHRNIDRLWWKWQQDPKNAAVANTYSGNVGSGTKNKDAKPTDVMKFLGLFADAPVSQALSTVSNGVSGLMCFTYSNSITVAQHATVSKRELSIFDKTTPDAFDRTHPFNLRPPTRLSDAFYKSWMYSAEEIAKIRDAESQIKKFTDFLNTKPINFGNSLKNVQKGNQVGWVSKTQEQQAEEDAVTNALIAEYGVKFTF
ncbi:hypothetical protein HDU91_006982 [Kappamyces sp. JEL0680]|nr:hypothetical protein HDU91_006982 [Kappamyces sp. JEL0680]